MRQDASRADYAAILNLVEDNRVYPFPGLGNTFPTEEKTALNYAFALLKPMKPASEAALQIARLNHHSVKLKLALESLAEINDHLFSGQHTEAKAALDHHRRLYGLSLITLKKDLLLALDRDGLPGLSRRYKALMASSQSTAWALLAHYVYDIMDPTYNPIRAALRWLRLADERVHEHPWYARILQDEILTRSGNEQALACSLLRYSTLSLLDLALLIWRKRNAHALEITLQSAFSNLSTQIETTLTERFSSHPIPISPMYSNRRSEFADVEIYRTSFFFDDIASVIEWRGQINRIVFAERQHELRENADRGTLRLNGAAQKVGADPKIVSTIVDELADWEDIFLAADSNIRSRRFLYAALAAEGVRRIAAGSQFDPDSAAEIFAATEDIQLFVSTPTLVNLLDSHFARRSPLLTFVLWELIYRQSRTQDNELDRRLAFMRLFVNNSQLIDGFENISKTSPTAATLLARTCSRTFLERLFMMMSSVKDVLEARLAVCQWLIERNDPASDNLREECDALVRELANLEARSDLDSTRVHVDEESLREWFEILLAANVTRYKQTAIAEGPGAAFGTLLTFFSNSEKSGPKVDDFTAETQIGSEFLLLGIVDATLKAFVSDRTFGLDAYLSRRIRHGTLNGHVMTPVTRVLGQLAELVELHERAHDSGGRTDALRFADDFRKFLVAELDRARKDIIQIRSSEHPKGLIQAQWRTAVNIQHLDAMIGRVHARVLESGGLYDIFPDIYSFCWDCLESDLAQLRLYMLREFAPAAMRKLTGLYDPLSSEDREIVFPFLHECREVIEARVREVCGWFIRPVFRRDRYSLKMLISTTLSIVRELDYEYAFTEEVVVSDEISLNRGSFDVFGDALFVLLGNAARHGARDGHIQVAAQVLTEKPNVVELNISSEVANLEQYKDAISRIEMAFNKDHQAIDQAAVQEGFSGLMKLAGLIRRVRSSNVVLRLDGDEENLKITFSLTLPSEITVTRMRG